MTKAQLSKALRVHIEGALGKWGHPADGAWILTADSLDDFCDDLAHRVSVEPPEED